MQEQKRPRTTAVIEAFPLSPIQEGMLAHALLAPGTGIDIVQIACRFRESLDLALFARAWRETVNRFPIFRTRFQWADGGSPRQEVLEDLEFPWAEYDWRDIPAAIQEARFNDLLLADRSQGFAMDDAPLFRFYLIHCGTDDYRFAFSFHHALLDGSSFPPVAIEAFERYEALRQGRLSSSLEVVPYRRYVDWLIARDLRNDEAFWRARLAGVRSPTPIPGNPTSAQDGPARERYGERELFLSETESRALDAYVERHRLTLNTLVQGAWAVLLGRHAGQDEVVFGVTRRCRHGSVDGAERIVGPMLNTLPMRVSLPPDALVSTWLGELRAQWNGLRAVEHSPAPMVHSWSEVPAGTPLFETIAVFETSPLDESMHARGGEWTRRDFWAHHQTNYPLTLNGYSGTRLRLRIIYDAERFQASAIERLLGHLGTLLRGILTSDQITLGALPMLTDAERRQVLVDWNATEVRYPAGETLTALLEAQALRTPDAIAVQSEAGDLSYADLHAQANQLAHHLRTLGVGPGTLVAISAERSAELVIALLGVLKAGGAYVPLDPEYPRERLAFMLEDTNAPVLLTQARLLDALPAHGGITFCLDRDWDAVSTQPRTAPPPTSGPNDLAYMIYTSGSTGRPKGALNAHRGIVNRLRWMQDRFELTPADAVLQKTPFSFDVSVWEFFWPLLAGARLVMARPGGHRDPAYLGDAIRRERVTIVHFVPSMLRAFLAEPSTGGCTSLRDVMCSGEALPPELVDLFFERLPARLHNLYGPTEAAVDVTCWTCEAGSDRGSIPIGRPIANTQTYILDREGEPLPAGAAGELYLGGVQVGLGYRNRPDLTQQRFIPDRFSGRTGAMLYRTGDLARYLEDGNIEFLGRLDDQVKIRGFRIELGEIETVLAQQAGVRAAAVGVFQGRPGEQRLVGYYCTESGATIDPAALRAGLARSLPEYMVPAALIPLAELPLSPNGKLDRKALPAPDPVHTAERVAPRSEVESALAGIWADLFKRDAIGITENFFELGGDSILSIYIAVRARQAGIEVLPKDILQHQTIEAIARIAGAARGIRREQGRVFGTAPLTPVQRWFFEQPLPSAGHWNQAFLFTAPSDLDGASLLRALAAVGEHHDALRLRFTQEGGVWTQAHDTVAAAPPLNIEDLSALPGAERSAELERRAAVLQASLDLGRGPLLRGALFRMGAGELSRVLLVAHHLVVDGISWRILIEDLEAAYLADRAGRPIGLPEKSSAFAHWAAGLAEYARSSGAAAERAWWAELTRTEWPPMPPTAGGGDGNLEGTARMHTVTLDEAETAALLREVSSAYSVQINDTLLTALSSALASWSGNSEVALDLEGHGREDVIADGDFSRTVGWFTSVFPIRLTHHAGASVGHQLLNVKESLRAIPQRGIGYGVLRYLAGATELQRPDPAVSFNYLGQFDQVLAGSRLFGFGTEPAGPWRGANNPRRYRFELNALVVGGRLELRWTWQPALDSEETVTRLATDMAARLRALVAHCRLPDSGGHSPSDFPLAGLAQESVDALLGADRNVADLYPLTPMQLLFYTEASAGTDPGFEQWEYRLSGTLDPALLRQSWEATVARHTALRTAIVPGPGGTPLQLVRKSAPISWSELDWRGIPADVQEARLGDVRQEDRRRGFALEKAPLTRLTLIRRADQDYSLLWSHHHILIDRLSWPVILGEVGAQYESLRAGHAPRLPAAPNFGEFLGWLGGRDLEAAEQFWRAELDGFGSPIVLSSQVAAGELAIHDVAASLGPVLAARLTRVARAHRLTINTIIQGLWALWLSRFAGETDVVFGLAVAGRPDDLPGVERTVGMFINNVPVRVRVNQDETMAVWLGGLQRRHGERQPFEFTPLSRVHEWGQVASTARLFESLVVFQNEAGGTGAEAWLGPSIGIAMAPVATRTTYPLTLLIQAGRDIELRLVTRGAEWTAEAAEVILDQLRAMLDALAAAPLRPVAELLGLLPATSPDSPHARRHQRRRRSESGAPYAAPSGAVERYVSGQWAELLGLDQVGRSDNLFELGVHSLLVSRFVISVREDLQVELPLRTLFDGPTVAALGAAIVAREQQPGRSERVAGIMERLAGLSDDELMAEATGLEESHVGG